MTRQPPVPNRQVDAVPERDQKSTGTAPRIVLVGGFLGAGKTTLMLAAAKELERRRLRSALILNDQGDALVDTRYADLHGVINEEVTGGCFCCRFSDLLSGMDKLRAHHPDVIFAEPVGSCTDIAATVLRPLQNYRENYRLAPFTVLVDPQRAEALLRGDADDNLAFLFRKQIEEADLICFSKSDISPQVPNLGQSGVRQISAKTNQGVTAWLDEVLSGEFSTGKESLDIDYAQYAQAEAALAWLNLQVRIESQVPVSPGFVLGPLLDALDSKFTSAAISIVHLKAIVNSESGFVKAALCSNGAVPMVDGMLDASPASNYELLLNLRCVGEAERVKWIVESCLLQSGFNLSDLQLNCFHPTPPRPERRYDHRGHDTLISPP
jgi:Ni2+-binding GTPase involved in maturation of urease and hydrogenase